MHYAAKLMDRSGNLLIDCSGTPDREVDPGGQKEVTTFRRDSAGVPFGGTSNCKAVVQAVLLSCAVAASPCPEGARWTHHSFPATAAERNLWNTVPRVVTFWKQYAGLP
jgi:hypothetical protein